MAEEPYPKREIVETTLEGTKGPHPKREIVEAVPEGTKVRYTAAETSAADKT